MLHGPAVGLAIRTALRRAPDNSLTISIDPPASMSASVKTCPAGSVTSTAAAPIASFSHSLVNSNHSWPAATGNAELPVFDDEDDDVDEAEGGSDDRKARAVRFAPPISSNRPS